MFPLLFVFLQSGLRSPQICKTNINNEDAHLCNRVCVWCVRVIVMVSRCFCVLHGCGVWCLCGGKRVEGCFSSFCLYFTMLFVLVGNVILCSIACV